MANTMVQVIGKLSLKMGVLLRGPVYEQKKCVRSPSVFITLGTYPRFHSKSFKQHYWKKTFKNVVILKSSFIFKFYTCPIFYKESILCY